MTTIDTTKLHGLTLAEGGHESPDQGLCLMEAVAYVRGTALQESAIDLYGRMVRVGRETPR